MGAPIPGVKESNHKEVTVSLRFNLLWKEQPGVPHKRMQDNVIIYTRLELNECLAPVQKDSQSSLLFRRLCAKLAVASVCLSFLLMSDPLTLKEFSLH